MGDPLDRPPTFLHPFARPAAPASSYIEIVRGQGALVFDRDGKPYVDALASLWYCNVGHGRAEIADAVADQLRVLAGYHCFEKFTNPPAEELCDTLAGMAPFPDARVFLVSSGSEAVDSAIKIARVSQAAAGRPERTLIISRRPSYHGVTYGGMAATGLPLNQANFGPMLGDVVQVPHDDLDALDELLATHGHRVAAIIAEPVVGAGGIHPPTPGYLEGLRQRCDDLGAWLILDEVICGFGRLGAWWGADHFTVTPDLATFAKGVTSGYVPLGGVLVSRRVADALESDPAFVLRHGHTYSGHPGACAAALACLALMREEGLLDQAPRVGKRLEEGLREVARNHPDQVATVRGAVAMWALVLQPGFSAAGLRDRMLAGGVIARPIGEDVVAFCPPLVITDAQVDTCIEVIEAALPVGGGGG